MGLFLDSGPFTTAWVGTAPYAFLPEFLYPLNLFLWSAAFQWLGHQIRKDDPEVGQDSSTKLSTRILLFGGYILCMALTFVKPELSIYLIGISTILLFILTFFGRKQEA